MKTEEKLSVKNLKHFPSMEWGENGGTSCEIYFGNVLAVKYFDKGEGGEPYYTFENSFSYAMITDEMKEFLKRYGIYQKDVEKYGEKITDMCILESFISWWENFEQFRKDINKIIKKQDKNDTTKVVQVVVVDEFKVYQKYYKLAFIGPCPLSVEESISIGNRLVEELVRQGKIKKENVEFARAFTKENYNVI